MDGNVVKPESVSNKGLIPPPKSAGVPVPPQPQKPATLVDVCKAKEYIDSLTAAKSQNIFFTSPDALFSLMIPIFFNWLTAVGVSPPTDEEIGAVVVYQTAVVFSNSPGVQGHAYPPLVLDLAAAMPYIIDDLEALHGRIDALDPMIRLQKSQAALQGVRQPIMLKGPDLSPQNVEKRASTNRTPTESISSTAGTSVPCQVCWRRCRPFELCTQRQVSHWEWDLEI
jgi:hypothetical protein